MKTTKLRWTSANLNDLDSSNLPDENNLIYFLDNDNYIQIGYYTKKEDKHVICAPDNTDKVLYEADLILLWCYVSDAHTCDDDIFKRHPDITTIVEARKYAKLTQAAMAQRTGIPRRNIEDWESRRHSPNEWTKRLIIKELLEIGESDNE